MSWDFLGDWFVDSAVSTATWLDTTFSTATEAAVAGSAAEWAAFDYVGFDQITNFGLENTYGGIMEIGAFELGAYEALNFLSGASGKISDLVGDPFSGSNEAPSFANKRGRSQRLAGIGAQFSASQSKPPPGVADSRIASAWNQVKNSNNPYLNAAYSQIQPNITAKPTLSISPAVIKRRGNARTVA